MANAFAKSLEERRLSHSLRHRLGTAVIAFASLAVSTAPAEAALIWNWSYFGPGINAAGTFTTMDTPDGMGFYRIIGITGMRNGEIITGLQPASTPIPGNEPFAVDNLVRAGVNQLSGDGFGYSTSGGNYASPFFASFLPTPGYLEVFSAPPFVMGSDNFGPEDSELGIVFTATQVPEAGSALLVALGLASIVVARKSWRGSTRGSARIR